MKTLIVNSYHADWLPKIEPVKGLVAELGEYDVVSDVDVFAGYDLAGYQAVVLSGSPNLISKNEYLPRYLDFLRHLELPTLGICYGHQLLARAFGARVLDTGKMIEGQHTVRVIEPAPLFRGMPEQFLALESHRELVPLDDLARAGFDQAASSSSCDVEAIHHTSRPLFGVQFHLERSGEIGREIMGNFYRFVQEYRRQEKVND